MKQTILAIIIGFSLSACHQIDAGFLKPENAHYLIDSLVVISGLHPESNPDTVFQSQTIEGVLGTPQIFYKIQNIHTNPEHQAQAAQIKLLGKGQITVYGDNTLPVGAVYYLDLLIHNEGHSYIKESPIRVIVK